MQSDYWLLLFSFMTLGFFHIETEACMAAGVGGCQGLAGCPQTACGGGCHTPPVVCTNNCVVPPRPLPPPPPPPPPPACQCQPTHDCGRYGCYLRRNRVAAASVRTQQVNKDTKDTVSSSDLISFANQSQPEIADPRFPDNPANARFMRCCEDRDLPDACLVHCTFQKYTRDVLNSMYVKADGCPLAAAADIHFCAAQGKDHRSCCAQNGVTTTLAGEKCLVLCDQTPGQVTQLDLSYLACYDRFDSMKDCFYKQLNKRN
uniref:Domain of unknown function DB domain-containing protein n=1 Tax=Plectus sambesii TaxID=2011161 RepID=A0A914V747_9BILA